MERDKLLGSMDAKVWTDEFMATKARLGDEEFDHAMMLAWFANAIMAGFDEANRRAQRALDAEREKVKELVANQAEYEKCTDEQITALNQGCLDYEKQIATLQAQLAEIEQILCIESGKTTVDKVRDLHHSFKQVWNSYQSAVNELFDTQAQLRQVEGERAKWEDIAGLRFAGDHKFVKEMELLKVENTTLRQLVEAFVQHFDSDFENPGLELYGRVNGGEISNGGKGLNELLAKARATLAAQDAGKEGTNGL